jgi:hypothetical protein
MEESRVTKSIYGTACKAAACCRQELVSFPVFGREAGCRTAGPFFERQEGKVISQSFILVSNIQAHLNGGVTYSPTTEGFVIHLHRERVKRINHIPRLGYGHHHS